jgi:hypothetical protein
VKRPLYVRLDAVKLELLRDYADLWGLSLSSVIERCIDQILYQNSSEFVVPEWLEEAISSGLLKISRCGDGTVGAYDLEDERVANIVRLLPRC